MTNKFNQNIIENLRKKVNGNSDFVYEQYSNVNEKNQWHIICSCMDWISVAINHLVVPKDDDSDIYKKAMDFFSIISAVDMIYESVIQLDRVFFKSKKIPFYGEDNIFSNKIFKLDDNKYFKEIRACFGAHPVNLTRDDNKWFASWPFEPFSSIDALEVRLSSNKVEIDDITFGINSTELIEFGLSRYEYISEIMKEIDRQYEKFCNKYRKSSIETSTEPLKMLSILEKESKARLNNDYYNSCIDELICLFSVSCNAVELHLEETEYKRELIGVIEEIRTNLQEMKLIDLKTDSVLNPPYHHSKISYDISKLYCYLQNEKHDVLLNSYFKHLNNASENRYAMKSNDEKNISLLKLKLFLRRLA